MEESLFNKSTIIVFVIGIIIGFVLGIIFIKNTDLSLSKKTDYKENEVLNKEINNCIDNLNICEKELKKYEKTELD